MNRTQKKGAALAAIPVVTTFGLLFLYHWAVGLLILGVTAGVFMFVFGMVMLMEGDR